MEDILIRLQNQPKVNGAHPKDIEDAIKEIEFLRAENDMLDTTVNKLLYELSLPH